MVIYCLFWILGFVYSDKCYNKSSDGVTVSWFCCNNYEYRNGTCKECKIGQVSKDGSPCLPCSYGRYGKKCGNTCSCQHNERCDIVFGCIEGTTVIADSEQNGICYNTSSNDAEKIWFCCNNHEEKNGKCKECESGYVSKDGFPCMPCLDGAWGTKCIHTCICPYNERCDIVYGCVKETTIMSEILERSKTTETTQNTRQANSSSTTDTNEILERTKTTETTQTTNQALTSDTNDGVLLNVYSMCAGSIALIMALATCCLKRKADILHNSRFQKLHNNKAAVKREIEDGRMRMTMV